MRTYITIQGDTWDGISYKLFRSEKYMTTLMQANPKHIRTVYFSAGVTLNVPDITPQTAENVPPWRRST